MCDGLIVSAVVNNLSKHGENKIVRQTCGNISLNFNPTATTQNVNSTTNTRMNIINNP